MIAREHRPAADASLVSFRARPRGNPLRRVVLSLQTILVLATLCFPREARSNPPAATSVAGDFPGSDDVSPASRPPAWLRLTPEETDLWISQGIGRPATHLLDQAARRRAGETTVLRVAVILIDFPDVPADRVKHSPTYYRELLFSRGVHPTGSVADFLDASSRGRLDFQGEIRGWYRASQVRDAYTGGLAGVGYYPNNSQRLAEEAIALADWDINFSLLDNDGLDDIPDSGDDDELIDGILIIHAESGREGGNLSPAEFTSIHWRTKTDVPVDGVFGRYFTLNPEDGTIGIFLHELGHLMGLPDLYPTRPSTQGSSFGLGIWSLMAGGLNTAGGIYPVDFDAWSKHRLGFVNTVRVFFNRDHETLPTVQESGLVYQLWANGLGDREYFLLENR